MSAINTTNFGSWKCKYEKIWIGVMLLLLQILLGRQQCGPSARTGTSPSPRGGAAGQVDAGIKILSSEQSAPKRIITCVLLNIAGFIPVSREPYELSPSRAKRFEWRSTTRQLPPSGTRTLESRLANRLTLTLALASLFIWDKIWS